MKLPANASIPRGLELLVQPRPVWQRQFSRHVQFPDGGAADHKIIFSRRPADRRANTEQYNGAIVYSQNFSASNRMVSCYFIPERPLCSGDAVTVNDLTTPNTTSFGCYIGGISAPFPRVEVRSRADANAEPVLLISVGGRVPFPTALQSIQGTINMPDGEPIQFNTPLQNGAVIEWPAYCPTDAVFSINGTAVGPAGSISLSQATYILKSIDTSSVDGIALQAVRIDNVCSGDSIEDVGGTLRISNWQSCGYCNHCGCSNQVVR